MVSSVLVGDVVAETTAWVSLASVETAAVSGTAFAAAVSLSPKTSMLLVSEASAAALFCASAYAFADP